MSTLINSAIIGQEVLQNFENQLVMAGVVDFSYNDKFGAGDAPIGISYSFPKPIQPTVTRNNLAWNAGNSVVSQAKVTLTIDRTVTSPISFTEADLSLRLSRFSERIIVPAAAKIASDLDSQLSDAIINSTVGESPANAGLDYSNITHGSVIANAAGYVVGDYKTAVKPSTILKAKKVLADQGCPLDDGNLYGALTTTANAQLLDAQSTLFNVLTVIDDTYRKGFIRSYNGIKFAESQTMATHTNGAQQAITVTSGTLTTGWAEVATLTIPALTGAVKAGDVFQAATSKIVNPLSKNVTDLPAQFQVVADAAIGDTSIVVSPAPISAGPYKNIDATLNGQAINLTGDTAVDGSHGANLSGQESLIFHKRAIQAASPKLFLPKKAVEMAELISPEDAEGFSIRFLRDYDTVGASTTFGGGVGTGGPGSISRFDVFCGFKASQPAWIVRVRSSALA